jgi:hypothetical protein
VTVDDAVTPHRLRFATPATRIAWPAAFGRRFLVTVDVEEQFDWSRPFSREARDVSAVAALPAMHERLARAGIAPLYFVDHPVAADPGAAATVAGLLSQGGAEAGAQLHPWVTPPYGEPLDEPASFAGNLSRAREAAKIDALTEAIATNLGAAPRAFRAGRYGVGPNTLDLLAERGFVADSSMRARHDYRAQGGADFSAVAPAAFRTGAGVIELPLTTIHTGALRRLGSLLNPFAGRVPRGRGLLARGGLLSRVPLTPEGVSAGEATAAIAVAARSGERLLVLSFHSPTLVPGNTPYVRDAADLAAFHGWWDRILPALAGHGYAPASLSEVLAAAGGAVGPAGLEPAT